MLMKRFGRDYVPECQRLRFSPFLGTYRNRYPLGKKVDAALLESFLGIVFGEPSQQTALPDFNKSAGYC
jgi:hypothetical protein